MMTDLQITILCYLFFVPEDSRAFERSVTAARILANPGPYKEARRAWNSKNVELRRTLNRQKYLKKKWYYKTMSAVWAKENPEETRAHYKNYRDRHREKHLARARQRDRFRQPARTAYVRDRAATDSEFKVLRLLRTRLYSALQGTRKSAKTTDLIGCPVSDLLVHLEAKFRPGMTWENYGPVWHVDHIRPCASFDLTDPAQQRECFHFSNLQPLFAAENLAKGSRV